MLRIANVVGARPNFVKIASIMEAMKKESEIEAILVHTGQHYDYQLNRAFFEDLSIPDPDINLGIGSGSHAKQTAAIMMAFEDCCLNVQPDLVLVVGDVNSTLACSLVAKKLNIPVAHVEAGLRSGDMTMPEEINRRVTDSIADLFFCSEPSGVENLIKEGVDRRKIFLSGNVMIDTLFKYKDKASEIRVPERYGLQEGEYAVMTLHRPSNTNNKKAMEEILYAVSEISQRVPIIFPMHPRTRAMVRRYGLNDFLDSGQCQNVVVVEPMRYLEFISLMQKARLVITDSGGLQEETTALGIPCITIRNNTERPITCELGTNILVGQDSDRLIKVAIDIIEDYANYSKEVNIEYWDGKASLRIVSQILAWKNM